MLTLDDVIATVGRGAEHDLGLQIIALDSIVGTVDRRSSEFDRCFRPRSRRSQVRWQRIAAARRRGETMPPIDVYRIGELHFVQDGHHRVSVARAAGDTTIEARVREVETAGAATHRLMPATHIGATTRLHLRGATMDQDDSILTATSFELSDEDLHEIEGATR